GVGPSLTQARSPARRTAGREGAPGGRRGEGSPITRGIERRRVREGSSGPGGAVLGRSVPRAVLLRRRGEELGDRGGRTRWGGPARRPTQSTSLAQRSQYLRDELVGEPETAARSNLADDRTRGRDQATPLGQRDDA